MKKYLPIIILILFGGFFAFPGEVLAGKGIINVHGNTANFSTYSSTSYVESKNAHASTRCWSQGSGTNGGCASAYYTSAYNVYIEVYTCISDSNPADTNDKVKCDGGNGGNRVINYQLQASDGVKDFLLSGMLSNYQSYCKVQMDMYFNGTIRNWVVHRNDDNNNCAGGPPPPDTNPNITVNKNDANYGNIDASRDVLDCFDGCSTKSNTFDLSDSGISADPWVWLYANPKAGGTFTGWSQNPAGSCETFDSDDIAQRRCRVKLESGKNKTITAGFTASTNVLNVNVIGPGSVIDFNNGSDINCGYDCTQSYVGTGYATLDPYTTNGSTFISWSGCDNTYNYNGKVRCSVTINSPRTITANFQAETTPPACSGWTYVPTATDSITVTANATDTGGSGLVAGNIQVENTPGSGFSAGKFEYIVPSGSVPTGNPPGTLSGNWNTTNKSNGTYALRANWRDSAGNLQVCNSLYSLDKTPPTSSFTAGPTQVCLNSTQTYTVSASDNIALDRLYFTYSPISSQSWKTPLPLYMAGLSGNTGIGSTAVTFSSANGFAKGSSYYFASGAYDDAGNKCSGNQFITSWPSSGWYDCGANSRKTVTVVASPNAPTLNTVSTGILNQISLAWTDNSTDELNFSIYRNGSFLTTVTANSTSFIDTTATCNNSLINYQVFANNLYACGGNGSLVKQGSCKVDNATACGTWGFDIASPSKANSLTVTARASDLDGLKFVNIRGYRGGGVYDNIYNQANTTGTATGSWNTSALQTAVYQIDAIWIDNNNISKTCTTTYSIDRTAPSQPGAITANATCAGVSGISWGASTDTGAVVSGLSYYKLDIDQDNNGTVDFTTNLNSTTTSYNLFNFLKGKTYKISVTAVDALGNVSTASTKTLTILTDPAKPVLNPASVSADRKITLTWPALGFVASNYAIVSTDTYAAITCTSSTCTAVSNIVSCGNHSYAVKVTNSCGYFTTSDTSTSSAGAFVTKPVVTAVKPVATLTEPATVRPDGTNATVVLTWPKDVNATGYTVNKVTPPATYSGTISTPSCPSASTTCSSTVTGLLCTNTYKYTVTATNTCGSDTSTEVSVKPNCMAVCSVGVVGGNKSPYAVGVNVDMNSTVTDEPGSTFSYLWSATGGSVTAPLDRSTVVYKTSLATGASPEVRLNVTDNYGAVTACTPAVVSTVGANKGGHSLESGTIDRATSTTNSIILKYTVANYKNQDVSGNSINGTTTIDTSGTSLCNSVATCVWTDSAGNNPRTENFISISQGNTTAYIKVTLKTPTNLRSGNYTFPVNFTSSVGDVPLVATVTVTNRVPTCTITGINSSPSYFYNRNQVIPVTLTTTDADSDTISSKSINTQTSCGSVTALSNANKADYTTPNVNGVSCVVTATVTDSQGGVGTCTATANVKASDIGVAFTLNTNLIARNIGVGSTATIPRTFIVTMENDQNGTASIDSSSPSISVVGVVGNLVNLCAINNVTCTLNSSTVVNGSNSKTITVSIPQSTLKTLSPLISYGVNVNATAVSSVRNPTTGVVTTTTLNGNGGIQMMFANVLPICPVPVFTGTDSDNTSLLVYGTRFKLNRTGDRKVLLTANATDADGDSLTYTWSPSSVNGVFADVLTNTISYLTDNEFNQTDTYSYTANDGKGGSCSFSGLIGTEASTVISGRVFEVQSSLTDDNDICRTSGSDTTNGLSATLADRTYPSLSTVDTSSGDFSGLKLKVNSSAANTAGDASFCVTGLGVDYRILDLSTTHCSGLSSGLPAGGTITRINNNCFTITRSVRNNGTIPDIKIPVKFAPNPYVVSQQGDIFSGSRAFSPLLKKPGLANIQKLISKDTALSPDVSYGVLLSQADNHNQVSWSAGNVDFTSQKGIFTNNNSITTSYNNVFSRDYTGIFAILDVLEQKNELENVVYKKYANAGNVLEINKSNYADYADKIVVVKGGDVSIDIKSFIDDVTTVYPLKLFIIATGEIILEECPAGSGCKKTIEIQGALISGINNIGDDGGLDLQYGIQVVSSSDSTYKNPSIKMILDPSIYLNDNIKGVKVLNYSVRELSE